jgi:putative lipoic acid-binding regulatory protein
MSLTEEKSIQSFRQALENNYTWPSTYTFKFIVPCQNIDLVLKLFEEKDDIKTRESRNGRYISVTAKSKVFSSEEVIEVYKSAAQINGVISL